MNTLKISARLMLILLFITAINLATSAQNGMGQKFKDMTPQQRAQFQTGMMKSKLLLDTQQIVKVKALNLRYALQFQPIIKSDENMFAKYKDAKALQAKKDDELKGIFTAAQFKQYKDFEDEMQKKLMNHANGD